MFRLLLELFDPEKDPSKRREIFSQQHGVTAQKSRSNTAVRISPLGTLDVFVLELKNLADVRRLSQMPLLCWRCPAEEVGVGCG
jgi:hypothetical protein